jgi:magnesium transporter
MLSIQKNENIPYEWLDIFNPDEQELSAIAQKYGLHKSSVTDCLEPGHLPKVEHFKDYTFIIFRVYCPEDNLEADSVLELTNKISIFFANNFVITVHRKEWQPLDEMINQWNNGTIYTEQRRLVGALISRGLLSYDDPVHKLTRSIELFERKVFLAERQLGLTKSLYYIKRKLDVTRRLLLLTHDIVEFIDKPELASATTRDIRDQYIRLKSLYDTLLENVNHLLNIYFNISAQRTNDTMRILTIFSVFFMPLTFIVGVYGMNFEHMPELKWKYGYPAVMALMTAILIVIIIWFKRKKWL